MKLIIEGPDGVGKTTLVNRLADELNCDILHMTRFGSKNFGDYMAKSKLNHIISDRSFLSEFVYSFAFNRPQTLKLKDVEMLLKKYQSRGWKFIILDAPTNCLVDRLKARGDEEKEIIEGIHKLRVMYKVTGVFYGIPIIDAESDPFDAIMNLLKGEA